MLILAPGWVNFKRESRVNFKSESTVSLMGILRLSNFPFLTSCSRHRAYLRQQNWKGWRGSIET